MRAEISRQFIVIVKGSRGVDVMSESYGPGLKLLLILATFVLLVACANIANLLLVRGIARRPNVSVRIALGAPRPRIVGQILVESLLLACMGGLIGLGLAFVVSYSILALTFTQSRDIPIRVAPSLPVFAFAFLTTLAVGLIFATAQAQLSIKVQPCEVLRGLNHSSRGVSTLPQRLLLIFQGALTLVLLIGSQLTSRTLYNLTHQDFVLATSNRYVLHLNTASAGYTPERRPALYDKIHASFSALGGVSGVGVAGYSFLEGYNWHDCVVTKVEPQQRDQESCYSSADSISPGYLELMEIPLLKGREFTPQDRGPGPRVAVVNETFARRYFPRGDALGNHFYDGGGGKDSRSYEVVGIFKDFKTEDPRLEIWPVFLYPVLQRKVGAGSIDSIMVHFKYPPNDVDPLLRHTLARIDSNLSVIDIQSMDAQIASTLQEEKLLARLAVVFGLLALTLAAVGLYGVTAYTVAQRTGEIGIRMALGSTRFSIIRLVLRGVLLHTGLGLLLGIPCALGAGYLIRDQLYELHWYDPISQISSILILCTCALAAGLISAYRAASIQPMQALRVE
jgi:predicted permease